VSGDSTGPSSVFGRFSEGVTPFSACRTSNRFRLALDSDVTLRLASLRWRSVFEKVISLHSDETCQSSCTLRLNPFSNLLLKPGDRLALTRKRRFWRGLQHQTGCFRSRRQRFSRSRRADRSSFGGQTLPLRSRSASESRCIVLGPRPCNRRFRSVNPRFGNGCGRSFQTTGRTSIGALS
jgi:hypothetical protein